VRRLIPLAAALLVRTTAAVAQVQPHPAGGDPRLQVVDYSEGQVVQLRGTPGYQLMVELSPDEQIRNVAIGDSASWQVSANKDGDRLFLKPSEADHPTNMTVVTSVRTYTFDLSASAGGAEAPYVVQFRYPAAAPAQQEAGYVDVSAASRRLSHYRISGDRLLRPASVSDDGQHTYISWPRNQPIPAVYAPDRTGNEMLLNGMMGADDVYVVDGAPQQLVFRIDKNVARADRVNPRKSR
jgi:type IV secretion system protein VirB9